MEVDQRTVVNGNQRFSSSLIFLFFLLSSFSSSISATTATTGVFANVTTITFDQGYSPLFGDGNLIPSPGGKTVRLILDRYSGSGFISSDSYQHGLFSASIRLPADYTAGVVVAFYTSNGDVFEKNHDELDFEFLGNIRGKEWKMQTNVYGNGSTSRGREERYFLPFDPTVEAHRYSILWSPATIIFYVDDIPIREVRRNEAMGGDYPSKPMSLYATIWDGSNWATSGGKYKANYKYSPFVSEFSNLILHGCRTDPIQEVVSSPNDCSKSDADLASASYAVMMPEKRRAMREFRRKYMIYSACYDERRYPIPLPECDIVLSEKRMFRETGHLKFGDHGGRRRSRRRNRSTSSSASKQASI